MLPIRQNAAHFKEQIDGILGSLQDAENKNGKKEKTKQEAGE